MKYKKIMILLTSILGLCILVFMFGKIRMSVLFGKEIKELFAQAGSVSGQVFHKDQTDSLPDPVKRYFNRVLTEGQPYISYARIKHEGQFKTGLDKGWIPIRGEQYATTEKPGFIWKGTISMGVARDMYISGKGRLVVSVFSLFNVVDGQGPSYDQGELLRWLGEGVLYPTLFLPGRGMNWSPIDANHARLTFNHKGLSLFFIITFAENGEITEMETERYMDADKLETWVIRAGDYQAFDQVYIPTSFEVLWRLDTGDASYAKFHLTEVEYGRAERF